VGAQAPALALVGLAGGERRLDEIKRSADNQGRNILLHHRTIAATMFGSAAVASVPLVHWGASKGAPRI
jgi:hypothetical protein